jgi:hypothetical protein
MREKILFLSIADDGSCLASLVVVAADPAYAAEDGYHGPMECGPWGAARVWLGAGLH